VADVVAREHLVSDVDVPFLPDLLVEATDQLLVVLDGDGGSLTRSRAEI
jgi:hypothetical protein